MHKKWRRCKEGHVTKWWSFNRLGGNTWSCNMKYTQKETIYNEITIISSPSFPSPSLILMFNKNVKAFIKAYYYIYTKLYIYNNGEVVNQGQYVVILILKPLSLLQKNGGTCGQLRGFVKTKKTVNIPKNNYFKYLTWGQLEIVEWFNMQNL